MKNMKRDRLAEARQNRELEECTFKPETKGKFYKLGSFIDLFLDEGNSRKSSKLSTMRKRRKIGSSKNHMNAMSNTHSFAHQPHIEKWARDSSSGRNRSSSKKRDFNDSNLYERQMEWYNAINERNNFIKEQMIEEETQQIFRSHNRGSSVDMKHNGLGNYYSGGEE